jgi:hypothetical protein
LVVNVVVGGNTVTVARTQLPLTSAYALRVFDERLLQQHPNEDLRIEDERLKNLDEKKKRDGGISFFPCCIYSVITSPD